MQKKKIFNLADSNIENLGSDMDKKARLEAAKTEKAWDVAGKEPGLQTWRIEKFKVVACETKSGTFYSDDSYIILNTYTKGSSMKLHYDVHFWIGATSSQDEYGTAAYKTVELDDFLGGEPVQHREVMSHESRLFLSYYKDTGGIRLLEGGVESGFNHVKPTEYKPRLLHLKGRKNVRVTQVPFEAGSINEGDVFVLDAGLDIYEWAGKSAGKNEKVRAGIVTRAIRDEREGKPTIYKIAQGDDDEKEFWELLGGEPDSINTDAAGDEEWESNNQTALLQLSDSTGELEFKEVATGSKIKRSMLDSDDVFIFDIGCEVFVWIGHGSSKKERKQALHYAQQYLVIHKRPLWLPISRIMDGGENELFESSFSGEISKPSNTGQIPTMFTTYMHSDEKKDDNLPAKPKNIGTGKKWKKPSPGDPNKLPTYLGKGTEQPLTRPKDIKTTGKVWKRPTVKEGDPSVPTLFTMDPSQIKVDKK